MSLDELPEGWAWAEFHEVADIKGGVTKGQKHRALQKYRSVPYLRVANVQRGYLDLNEIKYIETREEQIAALTLQPGDVLLIEGGNREHLGRGWVWEGQLKECIHQNHVFRARLRDPKLEPKYFSWYANQVGQSYFDSEASQTVNLASINLAALSALPVAVPPLAEQRRIVAAVERILRRVNAARDRLNHVPTLLKRFRQAILAAACSGRLTEDWRGKNSKVESSIVALNKLASLRREQWEASEITRLKARGKEPSDATWKGRYKLPNEPATTDSPELPEGWEWTTVSHIARLDVGFAFKSAEYSKKGIRLLRGENIEPGSLRWLDVRYWPEANMADYRHYIIEAGEIILALDRPLISSGLKIARAKPEDLPCLLVQRMMRFKMVDPSYTPYLFICLRTQSFVDSLHDSTTGSDLPHITGNGVSEFAFPFPPPEEQREIVRRVDALFALADRIEAKLATARQRVEALTQAVLAKAFRGELVPTEADLSRRDGRPYEPADKLLERIKAERSASMPTQQKGKRKPKRGV